MAVPQHYNTANEYFEDVLDFLKAYRWVYCFPNTHILANKVFEQVPAEWLLFFKRISNEELNHLALGHVSDHAPESLKTFFRTRDKLKFVLQKQTSTESFTFSKNAQLSEKKKHEIVSLAPLIHETCKKHKCDYIVDVGTGLGYLPRLLYDKYRYRSLGIESSCDKIKKAESYQKKHAEYVDSIKFLQHFVTNDSEQYMADAITKRNACITGLHACADLSVTILELFARLEFAKALVIMPCCYHRLNRDGTAFANFPASDVLKKLFRDHQAEAFLGVPFLRLACQGSAEAFSTMTSDQHQERTYSCMFRAILEDVATSENFQVRRLKRKSGKLGQADPRTDPFDTYLTNLKHTHALMGGEISDPRFLEKMREKWSSHKGAAHLIEALAGLQAAIQNVCENVVLLDRVAFLKEKGIECFVVKVTDQGISPRCHALVATKP